MQFKRRRIAIGAGAGLAALAVRPLLAQMTQAFPAKLLKIVPFGTGGGPVDVIARVYAEKLRQRWNQPVIVEAKAGASGIIAAEYVAKAAPDGCTVLMTLPLTHVNNAILMPRLPYDPVKDFAPLSMIATGGPMLVARANAPFNTLKELVDHAKKRDRMTYGTWGNGSSGHLFGELLESQTGANFEHVPYKSEAAAHIDLFGEALDLAWANPSTALAQAQAGRMKVLGIAGTRRVSTMPGVPTFAEQGFSGFDIDSWIGLYAPARTPQPVLDAWTTALRDITAMPDVRARLIAFGFEPLGNTPAEFMQVYKSDYPRVAQLIKAAGVTAD